MDGRANRYGHNGCKSYPKNSRIIPIPFSECYTAMCVEAIWQGLKVFELVDVDVNMFGNDTMKNIKRTVIDLVIRSADLETNVTKKSPAQGERFYSPSRVGDSVMRNYQFNF